MEMGIEDEVFPNSKNVHDPIVWAKSTTSGSLSKFPAGSPCRQVSRCA